MEDCIMDNKENDIVMAALHDLEKACCQSNTKDKESDSLISRFRAMPDGFHYTVICDKKCWIVQDNTTKENISIPFGCSVSNFINDMQTDTAHTPDGLTENEIAEYNKIIADNQPDINYLKDFISNRSNATLQECFTVWDGYKQFFSYNELWHKVKVCRGSSVYDYALRLLENYAHNQITQSKALWDIGGRLVVADTYNMDSLSSLFEFDLFKVLVDGSCSVFHICERCKRVYFDNSKKTRYCPICRNERNDILSEKRKENKARYLHKRIQDKLKQRGKDTKDFTQESNYYYAVIQQKKPTTKKKNTYQNITSEKDYITWLENVLKTI